MRRALVITIAFAWVLAAASADTRCYELRVYHAAPGKLEALEARFRDHTLKLFEKHGFTNVGYWVPVDNKDNLLIYVISSADREAHDKAWKDFVADADWKEVVKTTEAQGKLVTKVDSTYLTATDFSPEIKASKGDAARVFELRTYTPGPDKMDALLTRFRDHTLKLFEKHGMTNIAYWTRQDKDNNQLIYILAHTSVDDAKKSWDAFRADPDWVAAKKASEVNGSLTAKVESVYMTPTDFSAMK